MKIWLNDTVDDIFDREQYENTDDILPMYYGKYSLDKYYHKNDYDLYANDINIQDTNNKFIDKYIDDYKDYQILIPPQTNRFHANQLFKKMIDCSIDNKFEYKIYDENTNKYVSVPLIDTSIKNDFYKFCYKYT